jgi:Skp family chaperone for outer membrane proteins
MRRFNIAAASVVFAALFAVSAFAQTQPAASGKIGLVNTALFLEDKPGAGITKFKNAVQSVDAEFKTVNDELKTLGTRYTTLGNDINKIRQTPAGVPVDQKTLEAKATEFQDLETTIKRKQEDAKAKYERRYAQVVGPVYNDIIRAMNEFAKQKGYAVLLDGARLEDAQILLGFDDKYDVTREFITFYNARPATGATAAAATAPKP